MKRTILLSLTILALAVLLVLLEQGTSPAWALLPVDQDEPRPAAPIELPGSTLTSRADILAGPNSRTSSASVPPGAGTSGIALAQPGLDWFFPSMALDSSGNPHISYWAKNVGNELRYASWHADTGAWISESVDRSPSVGQATSLAIDADDHPHISYYDARNADLRYAMWDGTQWMTQTVDSEGDVGSEHTSIQVDAAGNPHVSYYDATNGALKYAYWDEGQGAWNIQIVDSGGAEAILGIDSSLQLDSAGEPHISYYDGVNHALKYASGHRDGVGWTWEIQVVDTEGSKAGYSSLTLDGNNVPHMSYYVWNAGELAALKYAEWNPESQQWSRQVVDGGMSDVGRFTSLGLDSDQHPHISYHDSANGMLCYAAWDGSQWLTQTVDTTVLVIGATSLKLDADGQPRIAYGEKTDSELRYAYWDPAQQKWVIQTVYSEEEAGTGLYNSLALDSALNPGIAYYDKDKRDLRYATRVWDGGVATWITQTVDSEGRTGRYCSLVIDHDDRPGIGYLDSLNLELTYVVHDGGQWVPNVVQDEEGMGRYSSMALDADENPHFASFGQDSRGLAYAYWDGSQWHSESVDTAGNCGWSTSIAVDAAGLPYISYTEAYSETLRYAHWDGSTWITQTVTSIGVMPGAHRKGTSIALDSAGQPHIAFYQSATGSLGYASLDSGTWITETVDSGRNLGSRPSLRIDAEDHPHIGYYDESNGDLKYAWWDGSTWLTQTVDSVGDAGWYLSLALEPAAPYAPHLSYMESESGVLKYAYWNGTRWIIELVDGYTPGGAYHFLLPLVVRGE